MERRSAGHRRRYLALAALIFAGSSFAPIGCCCIIPIPATLAAEAPPPPATKAVALAPVARLE